MASSHSETKSVACKSNKSLEFDFSVLELEDEFELFDDSYEIEVIETIRIKPCSENGTLKSIKIDLSSLEIERTKPGL